MRKLSAEPLHAAAGRCLAGVAKLVGTDDPASRVSPESEEPDAPFTRIVGFRPERGEPALAADRGRYRNHLNRLKSGLRL
jgi:hypothetical protein